MANSIICKICKHCVTRYAEGVAYSHCKIRQQDIKNIECPRGMA